jgi:hypothetical protein
MPKTNKQVEKSNNAKKRSRIFREILQKHGVRMKIMFLRRPAKDVCTQHPKKGEVKVINSAELYPAHILRKTGLGAAHKGGVTILECRLPEGKEKDFFISVIRCDDRDQFNRNIGWSLALQDLMLSIVGKAVSSQDTTSWAFKVVTEISNLTNQQRELRAVRCDSPDLSFASNDAAVVETCDETLDDK